MVHCLDLVVIIIILTLVAILEFLLIFLILLLIFIGFRLFLILLRVIFQFSLIWVFSHSVVSLVQALPDDGVVGGGPTVHVTVFMLERVM